MNIDTDVKCTATVYRYSYSVALLVLESWITFLFVPITGTSRPDVTKNTILIMLAVKCTAFVSLLKGVRCFLVVKETLINFEVPTYYFEIASSCGYNQ